MKLLAERPYALPEVMSVRDAVELYMAAKRDGYQKKTVGKEWLYTLGKRTAKFAASFGKESMAAITSPALEEWIGAQGKSTKTFNDYRSLFVEIWELARRHRPSLLNPAVLIQPYRKKGRDYGPAPSVQWIRTALLRAIEAGDWRLLAGMLCGFGLGIRNSEIGGLAWADVQPEWIRLTAEITKSGDQLVIERSVRFVPIFDMLAALKANGLLVDEKWVKRLRPLLRASGFAKTDNVMRHAFVSFYCAVASTVEDVRKVIGHSIASRVLEQNYKSVEVWEDGEVRVLKVADGETHFAMFEDVEKAFRAARSG
jgi:integrase